MSTDRLEPLAVAHNWRPRPRGAVLALPDESYHFQGDITSDGAVGAYVVTHIVAAHFRTSHLHIFNGHTMAAVGEPELLGRHKISAARCFGAAFDWQGARAIKTVLRICLSPSGNLVAVVTSTDMESQPMVDDSDITFVDKCQ